MKIGIIKEGKVPPDFRVALTPKQCRSIIDNFSNVEVFIQKSPIRTYSDAQYEAEGLPLVDTLEHCDVIIGVKEVNLDDLIPTNFKNGSRYKKTGKAGIFAGSLELVKEGNLSMKQDNLFDDIYVREVND